jgi:hypothetical protein
METLEIGSDGKSTKTIVSDFFVLTNSDASSLLKWDSDAGSLSIGNA